MKDGGTAFICGDLGDHCAAEKCADVSGFLCDYPVGHDKTCDLPLCDSHAYEIAPNIHYCPGHFKLWSNFLEEGKAAQVLENIASFKPTALNAEIAELKRQNKYLQERVDELTKPRPIRPKA